VSPASASGGYDHADEGKYRRYARTRSSAVRSSGAALWISPLPTATDGPPSSSFVTDSPSDSSTTGGPAVKIDAPSLITVKSDIGATSAPCPADAPSTAVTSGTRPEQRPCASRSVGVRACAPPPARNPAPSRIITSGTRSSSAISATR
jgi:hypothetical protein